MLSPLKTQLLTTVSPVALNPGMQAAQVTKFKLEADAWIAAHPGEARKMANAVAKHGVENVSIA